MLLLGAGQPLGVEADAFWKEPGRADDLSRIDALGPSDLLAYARLDRPAILELAKDVGLNTDDNVRIEFSAPLFMHYDTSSANEEMILRYARERDQLEGISGP
jgi:hypothetical protein